VPHIDHTQPPGTSWDVIVIGGGITGAGVFLEAVRLGLRTLLVEQFDFAWGTSSRSSKLVHGGLRYLKQGRLIQMLSAVRQREYLLREIPGLITPVDFMIPVYGGRRPGRMELKFALTLYDLAAGRRQHHYRGRQSVLAEAPGLRADALQGAFVFTDAQTDDARLVLRIITEGIAGGGCAMHYTTVRKVLRNGTGRVRGVETVDTESGDVSDHTAQVVINATGAWADALHPVPTKQRRIRPLRGSHLVFPGDLLPLNAAVSFNHPADYRSVFIVPWEGVLLAGTTDVDHRLDPQAEPRISAEETRYLLDAVRYIFPGRPIGPTDAVSAFAGARPVLGNGDRDPSDESREHRVWTDSGLVTVTGGKLTTFRKLAHDALRAAGVAKSGRPPSRTPFLSTGGSAADHRHARLLARFGPAVRPYMDTFTEDLLSPVPGTTTLWAELALAAETESVRHLDDLLLRRVRLGLKLPGGGSGHMARIRAVCQPRLGWSDDHWDRERRRYEHLWQASYAPPAPP
jgi:glycerol-3-phosphate dehydrogenase